MAWSPERGFEVLSAPVCVPKIVVKERRATVRVPDNRSAWRRAGADMRATGSCIER